MSYIELTGVKGYNTPIYAIQDLSLIQLKIIKEGISKIRFDVINAENIERKKFLKEIEHLENMLKEIE